MTILNPATPEGSGPAPCAPGAVWLVARVLSKVDSDGILFPVLRETRRVSAHWNSRYIEVYRLE